MLQEDFPITFRNGVSDPVILEIVQNCYLDIDVNNIDHLFSEGIEYVFSERERSGEEALASFPEKGEKRWTKHFQTP